MADDFNPFLNAGLLGMMGPNIYEDQKFSGKPLQLPGYYTGSAGSQPPTDAMGKPIQSFVDANNAAQTQYQQQLAQFNAATPSAPAQGTTMTSVPDLSSWGAPGSAVQELLGNYQTAQSKLTPQQLKIQAETRAMDTSNAQNIANLNMNKTAGGGMGAGNNVINTGPSYSSPLMGATAAPPAAAGPTPPTPPDMRQAYLDALANPGKVTTPGANVPASPPLGTPDVMTAFLAAHPQGGSKGAGNYDNSGFFNTLNRLETA